MNRRQFLAVLASTIPLAGCTGGPDDPIMMLAVNQGDTVHTVTVWVLQGDTLAVANTVEGARIPKSSARCPGSAVATG